MYIEIANDIVEDAIGKAANDVNDSLDLLILFALNAQRGKHIVHVPCLHNNPETIRALTNLMGRSYVDFLRQSERMYYQLPRIKELVSNYVLVSFNRQTDDGKAILINPIIERKFEAYNETHVITENILDSIFFKYIVKFYLRENAIRYCNISFYPVMGGGDTTADVLRHEIEDGRFLCLVITDSDRKFPDSKYGQTALKIKDVMETYSPFHCDLYIMDQVMEVENLIPFSVVEKAASNRGFSQVFGKDASFYDMKCGLTLNCLFDDNVCRYWSKQLYQGEINLEQRNDAKAHSSSRKNYQSYIESHNYNKQLTSGFGSDLLYRCTNDFDVNGNRIDASIKEDLMKVKRRDLTTFQLNEWLRIGRVLFSWTCGMTQRRVG